MQPVRRGVESSAAAFLGCSPKRNHSASLKRILKKKKRGTGPQFSESVADMTFVLATERSLAQFTSDVNVNDGRKIQISSRCQTSQAAVFPQDAAFSVLNSPSVPSDRVEEYGPRGSDSTMTPPMSAVHESEGRGSATLTLAKCPDSDCR